MSYSLSPARLIMLVLAITLGLCPFPALAQDGPSVRVFVAIPESFPDVDARAVIIRERGLDVILLRETEATAEAVAMSLVALRRVRERHPASELGQMIPIVGFARTRPLPDEHRAELESLLDQLARRPMTDVGNLGLGRWVRYQGR